MGRERERDTRRVSYLRNFFRIYHHSMNRIESNIKIRVCNAFIVNDRPRTTNYN